MYWPNEIEMNRSRALQLLTEHKPVLAERFGVTALAVFGSTARDSAGDESDIDILVDFDGPATSNRYFGVQFYLEDLLGRRVDLVTEKALRRELRPFIEKEALRV
jgi:predicted nucleotidyltransferase